MNCEAYSSFEGVSYDHRIVTAEIQYKQPKTHHDWSLLYNRDISDKYTVTLRNEFDALQEISEILTPNVENENFINAHMEAAAECMPTKLRAKQSSVRDINS